MVSRQRPFRTFYMATSCSCEHISLNHAYYAAFFVKKVGTKKAFRGITPRSLPPCTVKNLPSSHSLLLCHHLKWGAVAKEIHVHRSQLRDRPCGLYPSFELHAVACSVSLFAHPHGCVQNVRTNKPSPAGEGGLFHDSEMVDEE